MYKYSKVIIPFLLAALPIAAMIAYINYTKKIAITNSEESNQVTNKSISFGTDSWPIFRGDFALTGRAEGDLPDKLEPAWQFKTGGSVKSTVIANNGIAYITSTDKKIYAANLQTGDEIWYQDLGSEIEAPALFSNDIIYAGTIDGDLFALNAEDGSIRWKYETKHQIAGSATALSISTGLQILFGSYDDNLYALDEDSNLLWNYETDSYINGTPAVGKKIALGGCDAYLHIVAPDDPNNALKTDTGSYIPSSPAIYEGYGHVGNFDGKLFCINLQTAKIEWTFEDIEEPYFAVPAVNNKFVIAGTKEGTLVCLNRKEGKQKWSFEITEAIHSSPVICGSKVIFGADDGRLYMVDLKTGSQVWSYTLGQPILSSPAIVNNLVLIGCDDGVVYAFKAPNKP